MNKRQESKIKMLDATEKLCNDNAALVATNVAFNDAKTELSATIAGIKTAAEKEAKELTGLTNAKKKFQRTLCEQANEMAGFVYAYASKQGDLDLKAQMKFSLTGLLALREEKLTPKCKSIVQAATDNLPALATYGVTAATIAELQASINSYTTSQPANTTAKAVKKSYSDEIKKLLKTADGILKDRMDKMVKTFTDTDANFVAAFQDARKITDPSYKKKEIKKAEQQKPAA